MKTIIFVLFFISTLSHTAWALPVGWPDPPPPTKAEIEAVDKMFVKVRYILGAAFGVDFKRGIDPAASTTYKNIPDFVKKTKRLKQDIKKLREEASSLNLQAFGGYIHRAVGHTEYCVSSFLNSAGQHCQLALVALKDYLWEKKFVGVDFWSGYPVGTEWSGFPESMK
ncbi:MAG: hypothetical protein O7D86_03390 [Proteobacteria bacterium]|nr:hypothetical protein [Pseudomonadota bacterium]